MRRNLYIFTILIFISGLVLTACQKNPVDKEDVVEEIPLSERIMPPDFNYTTKQEISVNISTKTRGNLPLKNVRFSVYTDDPKNDGIKLFSGITNQQGQFSRRQEVAATLSDLFITTNYIGLVNEIIVPIENQSVNLDYNKIVSQSTGKSAVMLKPGSANDYSFLGGFNLAGKPDYLENPGDIIDPEFLNDVNSSLPENKPVPANNPQYLATGNQINTYMGEAGDVYVTFVHEGAGYKNVLGFYTYPANNPPASVNDIDSVTIIFPNVSYYNSGGQLHSGDKVNIGYFPAGTEIGWVLFSNGWNGTVTPGLRQVYSDPDFNPESSPEKRQHNVLLYDAARDLTVMGFEDLNREQGSDDDFNDALFYITSNPRTAIVNENVVTITYTGNDSDGDGVNDPVDDYPDDPDKAYDNFYPAENVFGSLAFEDLWPTKGDYDFNDMVIDYSIKEVLNAQNEIIEITSQFVIMAIGAAYENGFGFELPIQPSRVQSVSGSVINGNVVTLAANGLEAGQDNAVVIAFENAYNIINRPAGYYVNTQLSAPFVSPDTITVNVVFNSPVDPAEMGNPPYNPFIFINQVRDREVHLAGKPPTSLAAGSGLFNTGDDNSAGSGYYKTLNNLPWALDIVSPFNYPVEKTTIDNAHNYFVDWALSSGSNRADWYKDKSGYRNTDNIYSK